MEMQKLPLESEKNTTYAHTKEIYTVLLWKRNLWEYKGQAVEK